MPQKCEIHNCGTYKNGRCKECTLIKCREYRQSSRGKLTRKQHDDANRDKINKNAKLRRQKRPEQYIKANWKEAGIIFETEEEADVLAYYYSQDETSCHWCGMRNDESLLFYKRRLNLDHDHKTGRPRTFLCRCCNLLEGHISRMSKKRLMNFKESIKETFNVTD